LLIPSAVWTLASHPNLALYIGVGGQWQVAGAIPELGMQTNNPSVAGYQQQEAATAWLAEANLDKQRFALRKEAVQALSAALEVQELLEH
jgi:hypothetical protein